MVVRRFSAKRCKAMRRLCPVGDGRIMLRSVFGSRLSPDPTVTIDHQPVATITSYHTNHQRLSPLPLPTHSQNVGTGKGASCDAGMLLTNGGPAQQADTEQVLTPTLSSLALFTITQRSHTNRRLSAGRP